VKWTAQAVKTQWRWYKEKGNAAINKVNISGFSNKKSGIAASFFCSVIV
jgi:hypothetical protein